MLSFEMCYSKETFEVVRRRKLLNASVILTFNSHEMTRCFILVVIVTGDVVEAIPPVAALAAQRIQTDRALLAYINLFMTDPEVMLRARCIRNFLIRNQWCVARAILPPQALAQWQQDRVQNGPEEHKAMAVLFAHPRKYVMSGKVWTRGSSLTPFVPFWQCWFSTPA